MQLENTKTKENLMTAFLRESGAAEEYTFYAERAKQSGYEQIYNVLTKFADNERAHAKIWFKLFHGIDGTENNLIDAADLEKHERTVMYADFAKVAKEEGLVDVAVLFDEVGKIEKQHEQIYRALAQKVKNDTVFTGEVEQSWQCLNCGYIHKGLSAPLQCPVCSHPQAYFMVNKEQE